MEITTLKQAKEIAGVLGKPSKMPGLAYGIPAASAEWVPEVYKAMLDKALPKGIQYGCPVGKKLAGVKGTTCYGCYANKRGNYQYSGVKKAQVKRLLGVHDPQWVDAMVYQINHEMKKLTIEQRYFRWHDSGDILNLTHLKKIVEVCKLTPLVKHWLPTREYQIVKEFINKHDAFPSNLIVRISATKVDGLPPSNVHSLTSTVHRKDNPVGFECPAHKQDNKCQSCRACWSDKVQNISYKYH